MKLTKINVSKQFSTRDKRYMYAVYNNGMRRTKYRRYKIFALIDKYKYEKSKK